MKKFNPRPIRINIPILRSLSDPNFRFFASYTIEDEIVRDRNIAIINSAIYIPLRSRLYELLKSKLKRNRPLSLSEKIKTFIGHETRINYSTIDEDVVIGSKVYINKYAISKGCRIGDNSLVSSRHKRRQTLAPNTVLGSGAYIGPRAGFVDHYLELENGDTLRVYAYSTSVQEITLNEDPDLPERKTQINNFNLHIGDEVYIVEHFDQFALIFDLKKISLSNKVPEERALIEFYDKVLTSITKEFGAYIGAKEKALTMPDPLSTSQLADFF